MYYLWKDKKSTKDKVLVYITDYKKIRKDGKVKVDKYGHIEAGLIKSSHIKTDLIAHAQKLMKQ